MIAFKHNMERDEFEHYNPGRRSTVALEVPHVLEILQEMRKQYTKSILSIPKITVNIGAALVHPTDQFNKRLGRELALSRMKPVEMEIRSHGMYENMTDAIWLVLTGEDTEIGVHYSLNVKIYRDSGLMRIMGCYTVKR